MELLYAGHNAARAKQGDNARRTIIGLDRRSDWWSDRAHDVTPRPLQLLDVLAVEESNLRVEIFPRWIKAVQCSTAAKPRWSAETA